MAYNTYQYRLYVPSEEGTVRVDFRNPDNTSGGQPGGAFRYKEHKGRIAELRKQAAGADLDSDQIKELGESLFNSLFNDELRTHFLDRFSQVQDEEDRLLRLEIEFDEEKVPHLAALPWEFMRAPHNQITGSFWLATIPGLVLARTRGMWRAADSVAVAPGEKLKIGLAVAGPADEDKQVKDGDQELGTIMYKAVEEALAELAAENEQIEILPPAIPATRQSIDALLEQEPHILHFIGHGRLHEKDGQQVGQIAILKRPTSTRVRWITAEQFGLLFNRHRPAVVVMQACEGAAGDTGEAFTSVANQIVSKNVPAVVAMQYEISNYAAVNFAEEFYRRLAQGKSVDEAIQEGRNEISDWHETADFAIPVLYMRSRHGQLFAQDTKEEEARGDEAQFADEEEFEVEGSALTHTRTMLLDYGTFDTYKDVRDLFLTTSKLRPWRHNIPAVEERAALVDRLIAYLSDRFRADTGENALVLFLEALSAKAEKGTVHQVKLARTARILDRELKA